MTNCGNVKKDELIKDVGVEKPQFTKPRDFVNLHRMSVRCVFAQDMLIRRDRKGE